ncbi:MAG: signal peptidase I [Alphaproteobacteria bacterium]|nr:signal peptidase I [Alphaproteobacteria bacterium]
MKLRTKAALVLIGAAILVALAPVRRVTDADMAPNLQPGDLVWILPLTPQRGDVVLLDDPLQPGRSLLRRTLTDGGHTVRWDDGGLRVDGKRIRQKDMGESEAGPVFEEVIWSKPPAVAHSWRVLLRRPPVYWEHAEVEVQDGEWYLLADDRDRALDSRWWGPVAAPRIEGVVRLRVGRPDAWRGWVEWLQGTE